MFGSEVIISYENVRSNELRNREIHTYNKLWLSRLQVHFYLKPLPSADSFELP